MHTRLMTTVVLGTLLATATSTRAETQYNNYVEFDLNGVTAFNFVESSNSITSGQPYGGTTSGVNDEQGWIDIKAGRQGSAAVAQWFAGQVGAGQTAVCDSTGNLPEELNFAVSGTLTFTLSTNQTYVCGNLVIGQGHFTGVNNWWIGGPNMQGAHVSVSGAVMQSCNLEGGKLPLPAHVVFTPETPCSNTFSIGILSM